MKLKTLAISGIMIVLVLSTLKATSPWVYLGTGLSEDDNEVKVFVGEFIEELPFECMQGYGNHVPYQIILTFPILLVNNTSKALVVTDYQLLAMNEYYEYGLVGNCGDLGIYNLPLDSISCSFPIAINSGCNKELYQKIAVVGSWDLVESGYYSDSVTLTIKDVIVGHIIKHMGELTIGFSEDFLGNEVSADIGVRGLFSYSHTKPDSLTQPVFEICFQSTIGVLSESFGIYQLDKTYPFKANMILPDFEKQVLHRVGENGEILW
jgi:hypothetical protein